MGCHHGHEYGQGHECWGPRWADRPGNEPSFGRGYGTGYGRGAGFGGVRGPLSRETAAAQLEAYLAGLRDEVGAIEADLAELRGSPGVSPQMQEQP